MLRLVCIFLGCDLPIQLLLKFLSSGYDDRLVDNDRLVNPFHHVQIHITNYETC